MNWFLFIVVWALAISAGALIGDRKGRFGEGIAWTALLGLIGLVIIALRPPTEEIQIRQAQDRMRIEEAARAALDRERRWPGGS
jgi:hypothetical protein